MKAMTSMQVQRDKRLTGERDNRKASEIAIRPIGKRRGSNS